MNINVLVAVENYITRVGLCAIISDGILASIVIHSDKEEMIRKLDSKNFDILIIDIQKNNSNDFKLIDQILKKDPKIILFILSSRSIDTKIVRFINNNNIGLILDSYSSNNIINILNFAHLNYESRTPLRIRRKVKSQNLASLLSNRELEIALMLIKGETITSISEKSNLAITTVSTYKKRIFEKTKVKNLIQMAELFNKSNHIIN